MKVKVIAPFEIPGRDADDCLEVGPDTRVGDLLKRAGAARLYGGLLPVAVNGKQARLSDILVEGDVVVFVFPLSGG